MSIIGPRPQLVRDMVFMTDEQRKRHDVRPGLSGLAQVNGRNDIDWEDNGYSFSYTNYEEIDSEGKKTGVRVTGPKKITKIGMFNYCWPGFGVMISAGIEVSQLLFMRGLFEWDDMIHNGLGCMLGCMITQKMREWMNKKK